MSDPNPETGYREDCCWTFERQYCPGRGSCKCRCHVDAKPRHTGHDPETLLWVADDLRRAAEAHFKQADITAKRIERKHLIATGNILIGRAMYYEGLAGKGEIVTEHRPCQGCLDGCAPGLTKHCTSCVHESWPCDAEVRGRFLMSAAAEVHRSRQHQPYGSSFLDCERGPCSESRNALGLPLHGYAAARHDRPEGE